MDDKGDLKGFEIGKLWTDRYASLDGDPLKIVDLSNPCAEAIARELSGLCAPIVLGVDWAGDCPAVDNKPFDVLLSVSEQADRPYVGLSLTRLHGDLDRIKRNTRSIPFASSVFCRVLRLNDGMDVRTGTLIESAAYSMLLASEEFRSWLSSRQIGSRPSENQSSEELVIQSRCDDVLTIELNDPLHMNAMSAGMRDALFEALMNALGDPSRPYVILKGTGRCFSVGGELSEFGEAKNPAEADAIRIAHSCAVLIDALGTRLEVRLHGACIGSGIEVPAAAARRFATPDAFFQLPEIGMGLIPGAGGTVTLPRAIGRHRTAYLGLTGRRLRADRIKDWGLVEVQPNPA